MNRYLAQFGPESYFVNIPSSMLDEKGAKTAFFVPTTVVCSHSCFGTTVLHENDHFAKTGLGQTKGKLKRRRRFLVGGGFLSYSANFAFHEGHKPINSQYTWDLLPFRFKTSTNTAAEDV